MVKANQLQALTLKCCEIVATTFTL